MLVDKIKPAFWAHDQSENVQGIMNKDTTIISMVVMVKKNLHTKSQTKIKLSSLILNIKIKTQLKQTWLPTLTYIPDMSAIQNTEEYNSPFI